MTMEETSNIKYKTSQRFVVIGCGNIAQRCSIPALMNSGVTEVVCVVDTDERKREIVEGRFGLPFETDLHHVLETYDFESVYISTPNAIHVQIVEQCPKICYLRLVELFVFIQYYPVSLSH